MKTRLTDFLFIIICAGIGFFSVGIASHIAYALGLVSMEGIEANIEQVRLWFMAGTLMVWGVCALFALSGLFVPGKSRYVLILSPLYVPMIYGFTTLLLFAGVSSAPLS